MRVPSAFFGQIASKLPLKLNRSQRRACAITAVCTSTSIFYDGSWPFGDRYKFEQDFLVQSNPKRLLKPPNEDPSKSTLTPRQIILGLNAGIFLICRFLLRSDFGCKIISKHFVASSDNLKAGRLHSAVLSGITHFTFGHFIMNCLAINVLLGEDVLGRALNANEIYGFYFFANTIAAVSQVWWSGQPVIGASGAVMGLIVLESFVNPNQNFMLIFPIPGITVNAVQISQLLFASNAAFLLWTAIRGHSGRIAWFGHIVGMSSGICYASLRRRMNDSRFMQDLPTVSETWIDWWVFFHLANFYQGLEISSAGKSRGFISFLQQIKNDPVNWTNTNAEIAELQYRIRLRKRQMGTRR